MHRVPDDLGYLFTSWRPFVPAVAAYLRQPVGAMSQFLDIDALGEPSELRKAAFLVRFRYFLDDLSLSMTDHR